MKNSSKKSLVLATVLCGAFGLSDAAQAKGCIKGAIAGGLAGHMVKHGVAGAAAGCVAGHHYAKTKTTNTHTTTVAHK